MNAQQEFIEVALGKRPADLVIRGAHIFNSFTQDWMEGNLAIWQDRIVGVGDYEGVEVIDADSKYVVPGYIDSHVHIESTNVGPEEMARVLIRHGVTTIFADPHEIVNVRGLEGLEYMLKASEDLPVEINFMLSSCVPCAAGEHSGAVVTAEDMIPYLDHPRIYGLAEMMNYPGVLAGDPEVMAKLNATFKAGKVADGHAPGIRGKDVVAYAGSGVSSDHEAFSAEEAMEKLVNGMYIMIREGSAARNLQDLLPIVNSSTMYRCMFATDDKHLADLMDEGSIDFAVRKAYGLGLRAEWLFLMSSLNAARRFRMHGVGAIAPGWRADIQILDDLKTFRTDTVIKSGRVAYHNGEVLWPHRPKEKAPGNSMHIKSISRDLLKIKDEKGTNETKVIAVLPGQLITGGVEAVLETQDGYFQPDLDFDILKIAVWERHHNLGTVGVAFILGLGLKKGALASTVAHDSHNLVVVGVNDDEMLCAVRALEEAGGGLCYVEGGEVREMLPLPVAGLMSTEDAEFVRQKQRRLVELAHEAGVPQDIDPFILLSFMALPVMPYVKLTDMGLVELGEQS